MFLVKFILWNIFCYSIFEKALEAIFFENCGGLVMITSILLTMRSLAEERQMGTDVLLFTSPASDLQVVLGKYLVVATAGLYASIVIYEMYLIYNYLP